MSAISIPHAAHPSLARTETGYAVCTIILLASTVLQKVALPGTGGEFPLNLFVFPAATLLAFLFGVIEINSPAFICYALFLVAGAISVAVSPSAHVSALSLGFVSVVQLPLIFKLAYPAISYQRILHFVSTIGCVFALLGILQFGAQFLVGSRIAFFLDTSLPELVMVKGFNSMIPLYWTSPVFKSNGIFFLEPSFFCQFLAVTLVAELLVGPRVLRLLILGAGLFSSYSGTGLTMLALFLPFYFITHGHIRFLIAVAIIALVLVFFGDAVSLDAFIRRFGEFSDDQSSGWARFLSMFTVLQDVLLANDFTVLIGRGPGTVQEQFQQFSFYAFDPTWGKLIYEYGLVGASIYAAFFYFAFCKSAKGLRFAVGYTYLLLGGYLLNPAVLMQVAALVVWHRQSLARDLAQSPAQSQDVTPSPKVLAPSR
jgi:hypothetical protein